MAIRMPRVIHSKKFLGRPSLMGNHATASTIPRDHFAVYVGEAEKKRFVVPISYLKHLSFQELLNQAEEEYRLNHPMGGLTIPCKENVFIDLISHLS